MKSIRWPGLIWTALGVVLFAIVARCVPGTGHGPGDGLIWIKPYQLAHDIGPGPLTRIKHRVIRMSGPLWRWYASRHERILVESRMLIFTAESAKPAEPGGRCWTNAEGMRAWILSAEGWKALKQQIKGRPEISVMNASSVTTFDGAPAQVWMDGTMPSSNNSPFIGLALNLLPRLDGNSFNLLLGATSTEPDYLPNGTSKGARTNFAAACQIWLSNGGGVVLENGKGRDSSTSPSWLMVSTVAVDALGNRKSANQLLRNRQP